MHIDAKYRALKYNVANFIKEKSLPCQKTCLLLLLKLWYPALNVTGAHGGGFEPLTMNICIAETVEAADCCSGWVENGSLMSDHGSEVKDGGRALWS